MCGIAGIISFDGRPVDRQRLERMRDSLTHRGPDGEGAWIDGPVGLAHRRLSIVDLASGQQPMLSAEGKLCLTFNGEIYDHLATRARLEQAGHVYRTHSDTETILHLYEEQGERCVESLTGMFAFALWDRRDSSLLLARDRLGIKPLYYAVTDRELLFASEIKAILAAGFPPALNTAVLPEFLANRYLASSETFFRGIRKLLPGRTLRWSRADGFRERRYWEAKAGAPESHATMREQADDVLARLKSAVQSHLMSDVPLGLFLSGGIDSTALACLMAPMMKGRLQTFSVGFAEAEANELNYARMAAEAVGAEHREVVVSSNDFFAALPKLVFHEDEPIAFPSSVPLYFVSKLAREHVKVVLTGEGADELFLGYNKYRVTAWNERLARGYEAVMPAGARDLVRKMVARLPRAVRRYAERSFLAMPAGARSFFYENFSVFSPALQETLLSKVEQEHARDPYAVGMALFNEPERADVLERMTHADLQTYLVELLMKQDQMSMAASIESRVPFLDHHLVEAALAIPSGQKLRGFTTKAVLREALRDVVPKPILTRKKMGFPVPMGRWLREQHWPLVQELILSPRAMARGHFQPEALKKLAEDHRAGRADHGDRLWLLINLELWNRQFLDGEQASLHLAA
jgi:asparagine synthase (glutamine-hydrolysing)